MNPTPSSPFHRVHIIGAGLLGASMGLALRERSIEVTLADSSPSALSLAADYGAGRALAAGDDPPDLVVVATPPDVVAGVVATALRDFPDAIVMDVASVKGVVLDELLAEGVDITRFVPTHPMAGRERGGAVSARSDLFTARPWVVCEGDPEAVSRVSALIQALEATPIPMDAALHDQAVALISHAPQIVSSIMAARLQAASNEALSLAGGGIRDVTRIAAGDPALWTHIVHANAPALRSILEAIRDDIDHVLGALSGDEQSGSRKAVAAILAAGNEGVSRLPGKHGVSAKFASLIVVIDDTPGQLAKLLTQLGEWGVNLEDLRIEHSPGAAVGFADLILARDVVADVEEKLTASGWRIAGERS
jgi:prephenate dehydrogenase